jgi:antitoxin (DNA-binding transcriptional repressor) of toxin-antitoxin stability system
VSRNITQRELRNQSGEIMRGLDQGESFVITRNGVPVGQLTPFLRRQFVLSGTALTAFEGAPAIDAGRFRSDLDRVASQAAMPRA